MSAKKGKCVNDERRSVGTFGGKPLCGSCRPRSEGWRKRRALKIEKREQEEARKVAEKQTRLAEAQAAKEEKDEKGK